MVLTANMRAVLHQAERGPLRRLNTPGPGAPPWPAPHQTLYALMRHELLDHEIRLNRDGHWLEEWTLTTLGRQTLHPPPRLVREAPRLMHRAHTTTLHMTAGLWIQQHMPEPELVDPPSDFAARGRHEQAKDSRRAASELARRLRAA
jgi:hypothetical protein